MSDVFFKLPRLKAKKVIKEAISIAKSVTADELDCNKSFYRETTSKSIDEIFQMGLKNKNTMWHFCIRYYPEKRTDIGLSTGSGVTYFLWINMDVDKAYKLAEKYKLKPL
jgi:hypothetical protein